MLSTHQRSFIDDVCEGITTSVSNLNSFLVAGPSHGTIRGSADYMRVMRVFSNLLEEIQFDVRVHPLSDFFSSQSTFALM
jgi:hypothetical protein